MPEQPFGAPALSDDFDESQPGLPFRVQSPAPTGPQPGEFMTDPGIMAAHADWNAAVGPGRLIPGENPGEFVNPEERSEAPGTPDEPESNGLVVQ